MTSGSARRNERRAEAKVSPAAVFTWTCLTPESMYSTGSSMVMRLRDSSFSSLRVACRVVVFPEPVGPVTSTAPHGRL
jgi:hypothetical protein